MDRRFKLWYIHKYYENSDYVCKIRVSYQDTTKENITKKKLVQDANTKYQKLIFSQRRRPVTSARKYNEPRFTNEYVADINNIVTNALKQGYFPNKKVNGGGGSGNLNNNHNNDGKVLKVKFQNFGKKSHGATYCPEKDQKIYGNYQSWYLVQGDSSNITMMCNGREHYWFDHCKSWHAHSTNGHAEQKKKHDNQENKNKVKIQDSKAAVNIAVVPEDDYGNFISLGVIHNKE